LREAGLEVLRVSNPKEAIRRLYENLPDLIVVSNENSFQDGEDSYLRLRQASYLPIIVIGEKEDAVELLELGADSYVTRPLNVKELVARIKRVLWRKHRGDPPDGQDSTLEHFLRREKRRKGSNMLSSTEYRLAACLVLNKGRLLDYYQLVRDVWGGKQVDVHTLYFYVRRLREKLEERFDYEIVNCRGLGYRLKEKSVTY
jgi:DNA-binding response OmpR family regulator